jgi:hypothetical protein
MKFCYCPDCKELRPTSWFRRKTCLLCGRDCRIISIPISIYGYAMYALSAVGAAFLALELLEEDLGLGTWRLYILFGSLIAAMVLAAMETERASELAAQRVGKVR